MIAIRVDGNHKLGMGHIMRGLTLAHALRARRKGIVFISKNYREGLGILKEAKFPIETIFVDLSPEDEAESMVEISKEYDLEGVLLDKRDNGLDYIGILKENDLIVWDFDDLGEGRFYADHVFDANLSYEENQDIGWGGESCLTPKFHLGPDYMVLDEAFTRMGSEIGVRCPGPGDRGGDRSPLSILVSMGGSDPANLTPKVLKVLEDIGKKVHITAVIGPAFRDTDSWVGEYTGRSNLTLVRNVSSLAQLLLETDIGIISAGITLFEACCMGVGSVVLCQNRSQVVNARKFHHRGAAINLGLGSRVPDEVLLDNIVRLSEDRALRADMSGKGRDYVDGRGVERVTSIIMDSL